jgi:hypothetical protein
VEVIEDQHGTMRRDRRELAQECIGGGLSGRAPRRHVAHHRGGRRREARIVFTTGRDQVAQE